MSDTDCGQGEAGQACGEDHAEGDLPHPAPQ
jgi:hypothetical protein